MKGKEVAKAVFIALAMIGMDLLQGSLSSMMFLPPAIIPLLFFLFLLFFVGSLTRSLGLFLHVWMVVPLRLLAPPDFGFPMGDLFFFSIVTLVMSGIVGRLAEGERTFWKRSLYGFVGWGMAAILVMLFSWKA